ncbi:MAG: hypothetical protein ABFR82_00195 [Nitrospirota bacterium]
MDTVIDPKEFGLPPKTVIQQISKNHFAFVISRKSRIIMSDGRKILEKADKIKAIQPDSRISVKTSTPVCSKTIQFLKDNKIKVI